MSDIESQRDSFDDYEVSSPLDFFNALFRLSDSARQTCIPCVVTESENNDGLIKVQPIINAMVQMSDHLEGVPRSAMYVRPLKMAHGGFIVHVPILVGDTGYVISCDRNCTDAIKANEIVSNKDSNEKTILEERVKNPNTVDCQHYMYGFFIPCSWFRDKSDDFRRSFGDNGVLRSKFVISNVVDKDNTDKSAMITIDLDGKISIQTDKSVIKVSKDIIEVGNKDSLDGHEDGERAWVNSRVFKTDGKSCWMYNNGEETWSSDTNGIKTSSNGVEAEKILLVHNGAKTITINPNDIDTNAMFSELTVIAGQPVRDGDVVSIPVQRVKVLCAVPVSSDPLVFSVHDADR